MIRIYEYERKLLFLENANSPVGFSLGVIVQSDEEEWSFFPDRHRGYTLRELQEIANKITILNANSHAERTHANPAGAGTDADI